MIVTMEFNKEDAAEAQKIAEEKMRAGDFVGANIFVSKAQRLFPNLENLLHMKTICDVHISATKKIIGLDNWYGILQVQPYADADTIKKQYRKLAFILHPDKNKCVGAEAAFKLVGEANKWLSDQIKRSQYDRYRSHLMAANKYANPNSCCNSAPRNNVGKNIPSDKTFWTVCKNCGYCYKFLKEYINTVMYCSACQRSYVARNMGHDGMPTSSSTTGKKEVQDQGIYNTSRQNPSTGAESGSLAAMKDKNGSQENHQKVAGGGTENAAEVRKPQTAKTSSDEIPKTDVLNTKHQVKEPHTSASKTIPSAPKKDQTAKTTRKAAEESSKSSEVDGSDVAGVKPYTYVCKKRKSSREKPESSYVEGKNNGDFVISPNKKTKSVREFESNFGTKYMAEDNKLLTLPDSGASSASSHAYEGKAKKIVNSGNEDILLAKIKESEACDGNREDVALSRKIERAQIGYRSNENPSEFDIHDQEFNAKPLIGNGADAEQINDKGADTEQFNDDGADAEQFNYDGEDAEQFNDNGAVNVQQNECVKELLVEENEVASSQTLTENGVLKTVEEVTAEKAMEAEIQRKTSHDADDGAAKESEKEKQNAEAEFANVQDAFETLLSHDLSDHQKRLKIEKLRKVESGTRRKLSDEWNAICAREKNLKIREFKYSIFLAEVSKRH